MNEIDAKGAIHYFVKLEAEAFYLRIGGLSLTFENYIYIVDRPTLCSD